MTDLNKAIATLRSGWSKGTARKWNEAVDIIKLAVASGDLIPRADADLAVALMVEKACHVLDTAGDSAVTEALGQRLCCSGHDCGCRGADVGTYLVHLIRSLVPASALSELQVLRDERDDAVASQFITRVERDGAEDHATETADELRQVRARAEAAEAKLVEWQASQHYAYIGRDGKTVLASELEERAEAADAKVTHLEAHIEGTAKDTQKLLIAAEAELATLRAQVERLTGALTIAANRLHRCSVDYDTGTREFIEVGGWADEARAALTERAAPCAQHQSPVKFAGSNTPASQPPLAPLNYPGKQFKTD